MLREKVGQRKASPRPPKAREQSLFRPAISSSRLELAPQIAFCVVLRPGWRCGVDELIGARGLVANSAFRGLRHLPCKLGGSVNPADAPPGRRVQRRPSATISTAIRGLKMMDPWGLGREICVNGAERVDNGWPVFAVGQGDQSCPGCGERSTPRHGWHHRRLQDMPVQGTQGDAGPPARSLAMSRSAMRTANLCQPPSRHPVPAARGTRRVIALLQLLGHTAGGRPGEMLVARFAIPASGNTILRQLSAGPPVGPRRRLALSGSTTGVGARNRRTGQLSSTWSSTTLSR